MNYVIKWPIAELCWMQILIVPSYWWNSWIWNVLFRNLNWTSSIETGAWENPDLWHIWAQSESKCVIWANALRRCDAIFRGAIPLSRGKNRFLTNTGALRVAKQKSLRCWPSSGEAWNDKRIDDQTLEPMHISGVISEWWQTSFDADRFVSFQVTMPVS